ncbi:hypothetical protein RUM43_012811 [Polyplax serrata]|uniref:G-protein coupled receptors family 1 profile domain-containing protein n=1 Tax=Polyplax serrata TaxID=468196 RepID=A0AAN8P649_POLSC
MDEVCRKRSFTPAAGNRRERERERERETGRKKCFAKRSDDEVWIFGDVWCSVWLAVDVWMCTASILNLCAISLDRYVAVTRPVNYPSIMSSSRAKILIAGVWILSFVICFPPLVGWKDPRPGNGTLDTGTGFRIRQTHPMVVNHRPSATPFHPETTRVTMAPNVTGWLPPPEKTSNYSDDYTRFRTVYIDSSDSDVLLDYGDLLPSWNNPIRRVKLSPKTPSTYSGVPVVSTNRFHYPGNGLQEEEADTELLFTTEEPLVEFFQCPWVCELTSDTGYVIYSALGSFFIPMGVMLFFYWRIYRAAVQTTRAINQGFRTTKGSGGFGNRFDEQRLTLRIHRGRGSVQNHTGTSSSMTSCGSISGFSGTNSGQGRSPEGQRLTRNRSISKGSRTHEKIKISVSYPSSDQISASVVNNNGIAPPSPDATSRSPNETLLDGSIDSKNYLSIGPIKPSKKTIFLSSTSPKRNFFHNHFTSRKKEVAYSVHYTNKNGKETTTTNVYKGQNPNCYLRVTGTRLTSSQSNRTDRSLSIDSTTSGFEDDVMSRRNSTRSGCAEDTSKDTSPSPTFDDPNNAHKPKMVSKMGKRNIKTQVKRFRMETKAAKTLGIIVGGFILCWMPFFTIYLIRAFCPDCINPIVFSVLFWLGYCNSAINPCIYALFSKDFRFAFKKIICRFLCGPERRLSLSLKRRGSDGSQMTGNQKSGTRRQRSPSCVPPNSVGEDSDPGGSDSR